MMVDDSVVNREKTCPLLLRMFCSTRKHNNVFEYSKGKTPLNELQVYTWLDATLRELASLVKQVNPESRKRGTLFDFALVFPDKHAPTYRMRELGSVSAGFPSDTDCIMLKDVQFTIGDMIDVAITLPAANNINNDVAGESKSFFDTNRRRPNPMFNNLRYRRSSPSTGVSRPYMLSDRTAMSNDVRGANRTYSNEKRRVSPY